MPTVRRPLKTAALVVLAVATAALAHPDDPKAKDTLPAYVGPGYRESEGGIAGLEFASENMTLKAWLPCGEFGPQQTWGNDCWGYTSPSGREYALIGLSDGTGIAEITNPGAPVVIGTVPGPNSIWRDIKVYQTYAYAVSEGGNGIQVIPLADIDNGVIGPVTTVTTGGATSTHNVALNVDSGYLYRCGGGSNVGLRMYSLANPALPVWTATWSDKYVHDAQIVSYTSGPFAGREIAFCCAGFNNGGTNTGLTILDVTNKANIFEVAPHLEYPNNAYSHQGWLSPDRQYFYLGDELDEGNFNLNSTTHVFDVSNIASPSFVTAFADDVPSITHNLYTLDNLIFEANYTAGIRVFDATNPISPTRVGFFDTVPENNNKTYNGLWSCYPYFPSGTIIGSDRERGLFVWTFGPAALAFSYPDGLPSLLDPVGASVRVEVIEAAEPLDPASPTLHVDDGEGFVAVPMVPDGSGSYLANFPDLTCGAEVPWYVSAQSTDGTVVNDPEGAPAQAHVALAASGETVVLDDNFETDAGWTTSIQGATAGQWQRGVPVNDPAWDYDPAADADGSGQCWLTHNQLGNTDVDGGSVTLLSTALDLSAEVNVVSYEYYLYLTGSNVDMLLVEASSNGPAGPWTEVARHDTSGGTAWRHHDITQADFDAAGVVTNATMRLRFTANDADPQTIVEAGVDALQISHLDCVTAIPGDVNGDGVVGIQDFLDLLSAWGPCTAACPPACAADFDGDCSVGIADFLTVLANWS